MLERPAKELRENRQNVKRHQIRQPFRQLHPNACRATSISRQMATANGISNLSPTGLLFQQKLGPPYSCKPR